MSEAAAAGATATSAPSEGSEGAEGGASEATSAPPEPMHRIKVNGEEREVPLSKLIELAQRGEGAEAKFREVAQERKRIEALVQRLPEDPVSALVELVGDKSKAAHAVRESLLRDPEVRAEFERALVELYEYEGLPAEERRKADEDRDLRAKAKRLEEIEAREAREREAQQAQQYEARFTEVFTGALQAAGVPANPTTLARMALEAERALEARERISPQQLAERVREWTRADARGLVSSLDADALAEFLGDEALAKLRAREAARLKPKAPEVVRTPGNGKRPPEARRERSPVKPSQLFKRIRGE